MQQCWTWGKSNLLSKHLVLHRLVLLITLHHGDCSSLWFDSCYNLLVSIANLTRELFLLLDLIRKSAGWVTWGHFHCSVQTFPLVAFPVLICLFCFLKGFGKPSNCSEQLYHLNKCAVSFPKVSPFDFIYLMVRLHFVSVIYIAFWESAISPLFLVCQQPTLGGARVTKMFLDAGRIRDRSWVDCRHRL